MPYIDVVNSKKMSNRKRNGSKGMIITKSKTLVIKIAAKIGILHIFSSIPQKRICFPLNLLPGRKKAYMAPKNITAPKRPKLTGKRSRF